MPLSDTLLFQNAVLVRSGCMRYPHPLCSEGFSSHYCACASLSPNLFRIFCQTLSGICFSKACLSVRDGGPRRLFFFYPMWLSLVPWLAGPSCADLSTRGAVTLSLSLSALLLAMLSLACGRSRCVSFRIPVSGTKGLIFGFRHPRMLVLSVVLSLSLSSLTRRRFFRTAGVVIVVSGVRT